MSTAVFFEISWEVCNMVGGIHTVLASRVPDVQQCHGEDGYITIGPDVPRGEGVAPEFRPDIWDRELAGTEWQLISQALQRRTSLEQVSGFSSAVAERGQS